VVTGKRRREVAVAHRAAASNKMVPENLKGMGTPEFDVRLG